MQIYEADRGAGKTTALIDWWLLDPDNRIILCVHEQTVEYIHIRVTRRAQRTLAYQQMDVLARDRVLRDLDRQLKRCVMTIRQFRNSRGYAYDRHEKLIAVDDFEGVVLDAIGLMPDIATSSAHFGSSFLSELKTKNDIDKEAQERKRTSIPPKF